MAIKTIFFDGDGVLLDWIRDPIDKVADYLNLDSQQVRQAHAATMEEGRLKLKWDQVNDLAKEREFGRQAALELLKELDIEPTSDRIEYQIEAWMKKEFRLFEAAVETLKYLKPKYRLGMITNAPPSRRTHDLIVTGLAKYFDPIVISGEAGFRKPDVKIFELALKLSKSNPAEVAFIDDVPKYLDGAKAAGIARPILFDPEHEYEETEFETIYRLSELRELF